MRLTALTIGDHHVVARRPVVPDTPVRLAHGAVSVDGVWERILLPYDRVALATPYGTFLSCQVDPTGVARLTLAEELGPAEAFHEVLWPTGEVSLRTLHREFVTAPGDDGDAVLGNGLEGDPAIRLRYEPVPMTTRMAAMRIKAGAPRVADMPRQFAQVAPSETADLPERGE